MDTRHNGNHREIGSASFFLNLFLSSAVGVPRRPVHDSCFSYSTYPPLTTLSMLMITLIIMFPF